MNEPTLLLGDCREVMKTLPSNSVHSIVSDPPYELGFIGKKWDRSGIANDPLLWAEALRVLKPGGHLVSFGGSRTYHRMACAIEGAGFEIRDMLQWLYGSGFPKSSNQENEWEGWGTALKPAQEPIVLARKPLVGTVPENLAQCGTGALNVDECRIAAERQTGWAGAGGNTWNESNMGLGKNGDARPVDGRWPANVLHDGSPEVVAMFPQAEGAQGSVTGNEPSSVADGTRCFGKFSRTANSVPRGDVGSAARFFGEFHHDAEDVALARFLYCGKCSTSDREAGMEGKPEKRYNTAQQRASQSLGEEGTSGTGSHSRPYRRNTHPTVKPTELMRWLCRLITPKGGIILDPFMGSGSTGRAAHLEGFSFIGIEREAEYMEIARARIREAVGELFMA